MYNLAALLQQAEAKAQEAGCPQDIQDVVRIHCIINRLQFEAERDEVKLAKRKIVAAKYLLAACGVLMEI